MGDFIANTTNTGITRIVTKEIVERYDYTELLDIKTRLELKLADTNALIAECVKLGVQPKEVIA